MSPGAARIVLGTVQLGLPYGRERHAPLMPVERAREILDAAWALGVRTFDTAEAYGASAERLAAWLADRGLASRARVVTKIKGDDPAAAAGDARAAAGRFAGCAEVVLLTHGPAGGALWEAVARACEDAGVPAGQSVYTADEVRGACALAGVARVQAPGNVLDGRALAARGGARVPLDLRSVYLQGLLLDDPATAARRVPGAGPLARAVAEAADAAGHEPAALLVAAMLHALRDGDRLVLGADGPEQLRAGLAGAALPAAAAEAFRGALAERLPGPVEPRILDPRAW